MDTAAEYWRNKLLGNINEKEKQMEQITTLEAPAPALTDEELAALLSKDTFISEDATEETDADKVLN